MPLITHVYPGFRFEAQLDKNALTEDEHNLIVEQLNCVQHVFNMATRRAAKEKKDGNRS